MLKIKLRFLFITILIAAPVFSAESDKLTAMKLAAELIHAEGFAKLILDQTENAAAIFRSSSVKKDPRHTANSLQLTKVKYDQLKPALNTEANLKLQKLIVQKFSIAEIKYLINLSTNTLNRKFRDFANSDEFHTVVDFPYEKAALLLAETQSTPQTSKK